MTLICKARTCASTVPLHREINIKHVFAFNALFKDAIKKKCYIRYKILPSITWYWPRRQMNVTYQTSKPAHIADHHSLNIGIGTGNGKRFRGWTEYESYQFGLRLTPIDLDCILTEPSRCSINLVPPVIAKLQFWWGRIKDLRGSVFWSDNTKLSDCHLKMGTISRQFFKKCPMTEAFCSSRHKVGGLLQDFLSNALYEAKA